MARLTEIKEVCIHSGTYCRPLCLVWLNSLGGWDTWVFELNQDVGIAAESSGEYSPTFNSLRDVESTVFTLSKTGRGKVTLYAEHVDLVNAAGFEDLMMSPLVYEVDADGNECPVRVATNSLNIYRTRDNVFNISFQIEREERYSQVV